MRKKLSKITLAIKAPARGRMEFRDTDSPLTFRVTENRQRTLTVRTRINGDQVRISYPRAATIENLADARRWANDIVAKCNQGIDPRAEEEQRRVTEARAKSSSFASVVDLYMSRVARRNRRAAETRRIFDIYCIPAWGERRIGEIARADVIALLEKISDGIADHPKSGKKIGGPVMAARVLAAVSRLCNWYATRDDKFTSPVVRGMADATGLPSPSELQRDRALSDDEIRALWHSSADQGTFGAIVRFLLLSAQRRGEVAAMRRSDIGKDGTWTIDADRYKTARTQLVPLPADALAIIDAQPRHDNCDLVFTTNGRSEFGGWSKAKAALDKAMLAELRKTNPESNMEGWRLHDLRRTARSLMSRGELGIPVHVAEVTLGHVIAGIRGTYDVHSYLPEKREALSKLADEVTRIVNEKSTGYEVRARSRA